MGSLDDVVDLSELRSFLLVRHEEHEFGEEAARSIVAEELAVEVERCGERPRHVHNYAWAR